MCKTGSYGCRSLLFNVRVAVTDALRPGAQEPAGGWSDRLANVTGENRVEGKRPTLCTGCTFRRQDLAVGPNGTSLFLTRLAGGAASGDQSWRRKSSGRA